MRKSTDPNQCLSIRKQLLCILDVQDQTGKVLYGETPREIREAQPSLTRKFFRLNCQPYVVMESVTITVDLRRLKHKPSHVPVKVWLMLTLGVSWRGMKCQLFPQGAEGQIKQGHKDSGHQSPVFYHQRALYYQSSFLQTLYIETGFQLSSDYYGICWYLVFKN